MQKIKKLFQKYHNLPVPAKAALWFTIAATLQKGISLITIPIFTRLMSVEQYGQFSVYNSWLQIFTIITTLRLSWAVFTKGMSKYKDDRDGYTSTMQTITFMITLIVFVIYLIFRRQFNALTELPTGIMLAMFGELFVTPAISFWTARKNYDHLYKPVVIRTLSFTVLNALIGVIAVLMSTEKGYARILSCIFVNFCFGLTLFIYNRKKGRIWFKAEYAKFALGFNIPLLLHYFSQYILDQFDRVMIQKMVDIASAGIYSVAYNSGMLLKIVTQSINNALVPWQYRKLEKRELKELDDVLFMVYVIVAGCALMFTAFAPEIIKILADEKFHEAMYAIPPVTMGLFFFFMYITIANIEFFYERTKFTIYISMSGALLNIVLNYFGIRMFGYIAAAYTTLFCYMYFAAGHYIYTTICVKKLLNIDRVFNTKRILLLSAVVLGIGTSIIFFYENILVRYIIILVILLVGYWQREKLKSILGMVQAAKKSGK